MTPEEKTKLVKDWMQYVCDAQDACGKCPYSGLKYCVKPVDKMTENDFAIMKQELEVFR